MSHKFELRQQREGTVINTISQKQEHLLVSAVMRVRESLQQLFPTICMQWEKELKLSVAIEHLKPFFPDVTFAQPLENSSMRPDGGFLYIVSRKGDRYPILITEKKNQGTNDLRKKEGKNKQSKGNAIERLGKNVIGLRASMLTESIFPFICFGDGCDFEEGSSINDRVITIAMFGRLNEDHLHNIPPFNRGSFYFREQAWTEEEMYQIAMRIAESAVYYYFSRYGKASFVD